MWGTNLLSTFLIRSVAFRSKTLLLCGQNMRFCVIAPDVWASLVHSMAVLKVHSTRRVRCMQTSLCLIPPGAGVLTASAVLNGMHLPIVRPCQCLRTLAQFCVRRDQEELGSTGWDTHPLDPVGFRVQQQRALLNGTWYGAGRSPAARCQGEWGGGVAQGLGIYLFAFCGAYWPLATAHSDPLWARTCFGCVNGAPGWLVLFDYSRVGCPGDGLLGGGELWLGVLFPPPTGGGRGMLLEERPPHNFI